MTQPVTFKTAVKAKEKGFSGPSRYIYYENGDMRNNLFNEFYGYGENTVDRKHIPAPSLSELAKWLRKEKGIYVLPSVSYPASDGWGVDIYKTDGVANRLVDSDHFMDTYESAYEAGLDKALDVI